YVDGVPVPSSDFPTNLTLKVWRTPGEPLGGDSGVETFAYTANTLAMLVLAALAGIHSWFLREPYRSAEVSLTRFHNSAYEPFEQTPPAYSELQTPVMPTSYLPNTAYGNWVEAARIIVARSEGIIDLKVTGVPYDG
ncbi:MAG: hypothetical protein ACREVJ_17130, partial [Gammaproteobacteria bacterium]